MWTKNLISQSKSFSHYINYLFGGQNKLLLSRDTMFQINGKEEHFKWIGCLCWLMGPTSQRLSVRFPQTDSATVAGTLFLLVIFHFNIYSQTYVWTFPFFTLFYFPSTHTPTQPVSDHVLTHHTHARQIKRPIPKIFGSDTCTFTHLHFILNTIINAISLFNVK